MIVETGNTVYDSRDNCNAIIKTENNELISGCKNTIIPNSVTSIGRSAFSECSGLTSVTIPNSVAGIGSYAFYGCSGLTSITVPNSVMSIEDGVFSGCSGLTSITIPNSVTSIGKSAFSGCSGLTSVTIPNSVTSIGTSTFFGCSGLTSVTIPNSVTSIGKSAFFNCNCLTSVISHIFEPFTISNVFTRSTYAEATLYVPVGTIDAYKAKRGWKDFTTIIETDFTDEPKGDVNLDHVVDVADIASVIDVMAGGASSSYAITADVNGDGVVDVADIATVISIMAAKARRLESLGD